ncbi:uncharacterized protein MELLADRAFT_107061 [Melampsora larici-populina 98AG31]|uniref:Uncharacterized protein n=1 Tax=Melampsora larici-populina (strain 98AG31 / pathotype 3-4-7) TaxID=747676 RepID=F4RNJ3_MELLP|nr:uncharacterized protein MELLADRAFT_107061 [Melampsora larici-populina 98AG31]EGG05997.1 hypothetical protein MELLADRAFT_107061 [Melampsora larici-populina 98AG31]
MDLDMVHLTGQHQLKADQRYTLHQQGAKMETNSLAFHSQVCSSFLVITSRYKPGVAAAANPKAANQARTEAAKKAAQAASRLSSSLLHAPSPSESRSLCPHSPQSTRTDPGFVAQPRDSRLAADNPTSDNREGDESSSQ